MSTGTFGIPEGADQLEFSANYEGPLFPVYMEGSKTSLAATHRDENALLGLVYSAQVLELDASVQPNRVTGTASFFSEGVSDLLQCTFQGILAPAKIGTDAEQIAHVFVTFTGGKGRFATATGAATVEAELFLSRGKSKGVIRGSVILPRDG